MNKRDIDLAADEIFFTYFSLSGDHSVPQTNAMCREQEGNGGLDRRSQIRPKMGNLRGKRFTSLRQPLLCLNIVYLFCWFRISKKYAKLMIL